MYQNIPPFAEGNQAKNIGNDGIIHPRVFMVRLVHYQEIDHAKRNGIKKVFMGFHGLGGFILKTNIQT